MAKKKVVVIGSGLAGTIISNELSNHFEVVALERGPEEGILLPEIEHLNKSFGTSNTFCYGAGGTTNLWHNGLIRLNANHISDEVFRSVILDAKKHEGYACKILHLKVPINQAVEHATGFDFEGWSKGAFDCVIVPNGNRKLYLNSNVNVFYDVSEIKFSGSDGHVKGVSFIVNDKKHKIDVDYLVVCAGGLNTPKVLNGVLNDLGFSHDQARSKSLIDHPMGFVGKIEVKRKYKVFFDRLVSQVYPSYKARVGIKVKINGLHHICYFRPTMTIKNNSDIYKFKSKLGTVGWKKRIRMVFDLRIFHPDIFSEILLYFFGIKLPSRKYSLWFVFEQNFSSSRNSVVNSSHVSYDWGVSKDELENYSRAIYTLIEQLNPYLSDFSLYEGDLSEYLWSAAHHSGSVRMGKGDSDVNENLKLNALDNVYACDGSIVQEHSYANTGLTIAELAIRLSRHLEDYKSK